MIFIPHLSKVINIIHHGFFPQVGQSELRQGFLQTFKIIVIEVDHFIDLIALE